MKTSKELKSKLKLELSKLGLTLQSLRITTFRRMPKYNVQVCTNEDKEFLLGYQRIGGNENQFIEFATNYFNNLNK